jgi:hypothetical protein
VTACSHSTRFRNLPVEVGPLSYALWQACANDGKPAVFKELLAKEVP